MCLLVGFLGFLRVGFLVGVFLFCFEGFFGREGSVRCWQSTPCCDPKGRSVAEATRVEQPLEINY